MSKKTHKSKKRSQKSHETRSQSTDDHEISSNALDECEIEERTIVITVNSFKNIKPIYPISDIKVHLKYLNQDLGESHPVPAVYDEKFPLEVRDSFELLIDIASMKELDLLASNPVFITAFQLTGAVEPAIHSHPKRPKRSQDEERSKATTRDIDSLFSMYEMDEDTPQESSLLQMSDIKKKKKGKKGGARGDNKETPKLAASRDSKTTSKNTEQSENESIPDILYVKTEIYGLCVIDLIPLFHGETSFSETLLIKPIKPSTNTHKKDPEISITIAIKDNANFVNITNILYFTVESICNVPSLMLEDMDCTVCVMLPLYNLGATPTIFHNPKISTQKPSSGLEPKRWPGLHDIAFNANTTKYFIADSYEEITNKDNLNIEEAFKEGAPRIEYNYLKRNALHKSGKCDFASHVLIHREITLEIYLTPKSKKDKTLDQQLDQSFGRSTKISPHLHLMAVINVAALLYPGFSRLRIATPVTLFSYEEAAKTGLHNSFFLPKPSHDMKTARTVKTKVEVTKKNKKSPEKKEKSSSKKDDKSLDSQQSATVEEPAQTCDQVYDEAGKPCFIVIEIELLTPLNRKMDTDDLKKNLHSLQLEALQSSKSILTKDSADEHYDFTIQEIVDNLNQQWLEYNRILRTNPVPNYNMNFVEYLVRVGAYKCYTNSIITSVIYLMTNKYKCIEYYFKYHHRNYHNLLSELYAELIDKLHATLNVMVCNEMRAEKVNRLISSELSFFYAKEAAELNLYKLAERYFMDRIITSNDTKKNAAFWFDFAIYNIEIKNVEKAFRCVKEAVALNCSCKYTLLLLGALLTDKDNIHDAETCFLNTLILDSKWIAGWCVLYIFYKKCDRPDGMEMALDMSRKLLRGHYSNDEEHFEKFEDLAWSWQNIPKTFFFNAAVLLLKMRLYSWVEIALVEVLESNNHGYVQYLLGIVSYYKKDFDHALECVNQAKESLGPDYAILALSGHIFLAQSKFNEAQKEYFRIIESYDRPQNIHLVYLNCAEALAKLGNIKKAIKLILIACKIHETPHLWFSAGKLYYYQNDLLNAEECLNRANLKDNRHAEVWGYLTLLNLKLSKIHEAMNCYQQAVKSGLEDDELSKLILQAFKKAER